MTERDYDLELLIESGEILAYEYENDSYSEEVRLTFPSGLVLYVGSHGAYDGGSGLIVKTTKGKV